MRRKKNKKQRSRWGKAIYSKKSGQIKIGGKSRVKLGRSGFIVGF